MERKERPPPIAREEGDANKDRIHFSSRNQLCEKKGKMFPNHLGKKKGDFPSKRCRARRKVQDRVAVNVGEASSDKEETSAKWGKKGAKKRVKREDWRLGKKSRSSSRTLKA